MNTYVFVCVVGVLAESQVATKSLEIVPQLLFQSTRFLLEIDEVNKQMTSQKFPCIQT